MDTTHLFNVALPAVLAAHPEEVKAVGAKYQFNIGDAGQWHLDLTATGPRCVAGAEPADCTINIADKDFQTFLANPEKNAMMLFFSGKLKIVGNQMLGLKLKNIFGYLQ